MSDVETRRRRDAKVRVPVQERSRRTYESILAAGAEIISEGGFEAFTTNSVADRAGVNIASLYAYFNDKYDILAELIERAEDERFAQLMINVDQLAGPEWRTWVAETVDRMADYRLSDPATMALRRAVAGSVRLAELDEESLRRGAALITERLRSQLQGANSERAEAIAYVIFTSGSQVLDRACRGGVPNEAELDELKAMVIAYLATIIEE